MENLKPPIFIHKFKDTKRINITKAMRYLNKVNPKKYKLYYSVDKTLSLEIKFYATIITYMVTGNKVIQYSNHLILH